MRASDQVWGIQPTLNVEYSENVFILNLET